MLATRIWAIAEGRLWILDEGYDAYRVWEQSRRAETSHDGKNDDARRKREAQRAAQRAAEREAEQRIRRRAEIEETIHHLEAQVAETYRELEMGQSLAESFENAGGFPPLLVGGIRHGEVTGSLEESFNRMGTYYDGEVKRSVEVLINAFEPAIMLLLGGVFGVIILSIMLPLYDVLGGLGQSY